MKKLKCDRCKYFNVDPVMYCKKLKTEFEHGEQAMEVSKHCGVKVK